MPEDPQQKAPSKPRIHPWTVPALMAIIALGVVVGVNYIFHYAAPGKAAPDGRLPFLSRIDDDAEFTGHDGRAVKFGLGPGALAQDRLLYMKHGDQVAEGKVTLVSYLFTRCPTGCAGLQQTMAEVKEALGNDPGLHLLSVSLDPTHDKPEVLDSFRERFGFVAPNWWFLTGEAKKLQAFMTTKIGFHPPIKKEEKDQLFEGDLYAHDMRIALVDHTGHVRGFYEIMHPKMADVFVERLEADARTLLGEREAAIAE